MIDRYTGKEIVSPLDRLTHPLQTPSFDVTPGNYGDVAKVLPMIVVDDVDTRRFYTIDGVFMGIYRTSRPPQELETHTQDSQRSEVPLPNDVKT